MNQSDQIGELAAALAKVQGQIEDAKKDSNGHNYKYADMASVFQSCRKLLAENGLSIIQTPEGGPAEVTVTTRLVHSSGQWVEGALTLKPTKADCQGMGSAITYGRRYSLMAIIGIAADDDDGQAACQPTPTYQAPKQDIPPQAGGSSSRIGLMRQIQAEMKKQGLTFPQVSLKTGIPDIQNQADPNILDQVLEVLKAG